MVNFINELIMQGFKNNKYIMFHFVGGYVYSMIHVSFCLQMFNDPKVSLMFLITFLSAVAWEFFEYLKDNKQNIINIYGTTKTFYYDSIGDIIAALFGCLIISLFNF